MCIVTELPQHICIVCTATGLPICIVCTVTEYPSNHTDSHSPMPHWGMALALRTNSNDPELADRIVKVAIHVAAVRSRLRAGSAVEQGLVETLDKRYTTVSAVEERVSRVLGEHPQSPRTLFGLWQALTRVGTRQRRVHGKVSMRPGRTGMSRCEQICIRADDAIIAHRQSLPATLCEMRPA